MIIKNIKKSQLLAIVCVILFLTFLDNTVVSVALSNIQTKLSAGVQDLQWIVDSYMLVFAVFMLSGGSLGDILGRKKVMLSGVALFVIGSAVSMLSGTVDLLITGRVIMGLGAAASEPGTLSMIRHIYPDRKPRSRALGVWAAVSGIALAFGPIIGGVIIGFSDWRGIFVFNVIFGVIALIAGLILLPENSDPKDRKFDLYGLLLGGVSVFSVVLGLILGETTGYDHWEIISLFSLSFICLIFFIMLERRRKDPVLPLAFFKKVQFSIANAVAFVANFGIFAVFFFVALYLQLIAGFSGYQIALAFISMTAAIVLAALLAGKWSATHNTILLTIAGCLIAAAGIFILNLLIKPSISTVNLSWALAIAGIGFGICLVTMTSTVLNIIPPERSGMAASTVNTFRELGGVFGVAVLGTVVNAQLTAHLTHKLQSLHLPTNFQTFVIYAITHGGHTPQGVHVTISEIASHASLISQVTNAAYQAFGNGLTISLDIATSLLLLTGLITLVIYLWHVMNNKKGSLFSSQIN